MPPAKGSAAKRERADSFRANFRSFCVAEPRFRGKEDKDLIEFVKAVHKNEVAEQLLRDKDGNLKDGVALRDTAWQVRQNGLAGDILEEDDDTELDEDDAEEEEDQRTRCPTSP